MAITFASTCMPISQLCCILGSQRLQQQFTEHTATERIISPELVYRNTRVSWVKDNPGVLPILGTKKNLEKSVR